MARGFAHIERTLAGLLVPRFFNGDASRVGTQTPPDLDDKVPFCLLNKTAGDRTQIDDNPFVDLDVFHHLDTEAWRIANEISDFLLTKPFPLDVVACPESPRELPWREDSSLRRYGATYSMSLRRIRL
ncbi:hypothetical protein [Actinoplanes sp. URMC 104]|uniref:hypothetical protein n=1 Tax=Actinoplanes sp. URMC 104 TaxID=3423409 RepID=UPI003F1E3939